MDLLVSYAWGRFFRARAEVNCAGRDPCPGGVDNWRKFDIDQSNTSHIPAIIQTGYAVFSEIVTPRGVTGRFSRCFRTSAIQQTSHREPDYPFTCPVGCR